MITKSNLEQMLSVLEFNKNKNVYTYHFVEQDCELKVDIDKKELIYPENKGLIINERTTCNFNENENFVVFECVYRLFKRGYKPSNLTLEPKWKIGHGASGGRADIWIKDNTGKSFIIIECKTFGEEFIRHWKKTEQDGDQLFSYARQATDTEYLCMYASDLINNDIIYNSNIISLLDNDTYLKSLKEPFAYRDAKDATSLYKAWNNTYRREYSTQGIFENNISAFAVGKNAYSVDDLTIVGNEDIQKKYHEFATIMRQHNVSGRENAFDKLVNLFLAKIVDEIQHPDKLDFFWKGIAFDDYYSLQDRIQKLYKDGMEKFLGEKVTYIDNNVINESFRLFKNDPDATRDTILDYFRQMKFYTNNDFAFLDVHNEQLFYQNAEILLKIVKMLQDIKLKTVEQNQFLGDLFEGFLDQGVKQSEGQFFTPMPIVKFLVSSLPLESIVTDKDDTPKVIDYACGAGHFLNEYATQIKQFVPKEQLPLHYENIYGIEKEYRLSKVAKVSAFMYGQDEINIIYADALSKNLNILNEDFDVLIANPPYSVKGFLETLSIDDRANYETFNSIGNSGITTNNSIETFFIERASQLLKENGVAAIILPTTILSNAAGVYIKSREILLKHFDIIAIASFGSKTFGKTGTNTITLFMRKKSTNPALHKHYQNRVNLWFNKDFDKDEIFEDIEILENYCSHIGVDFDEYKKFICGTISEDLLEVDIFRDYFETFKNSTVWKNRKNQVSFKKLSENEKEEEFKLRLYNVVSNVEKEKLYYYALASSNPMPVVVVKSPAKDADQKAFLGYDWSGAKGNEGIKYLGAHVEDEENSITKNKGINNIQTPLFNPSNLMDHQKINTVIRNAFNKIDSDTDGAMISYYTLTDMLNFSKVTFDKNISLVGTPLINIESKYEKISLKTLVYSIGGLWTGKKAPFKSIKVIRNTNFTMLGKLDISNVAEIEVEVGALEKRTLKKGDIIIEKSGGSETQAVGRVVLFDIDGEYSYSNFTACLRCKDERILPEYLHILLNDIYQKGLTFDFQTGSSGLKNLKLSDYLSTKIPVPPKPIQEQIISECKKVDNIYYKTMVKIEECQKQIEKLFIQLDGALSGVKTLRLSDKDNFSVNIGKRVVARELISNGEVPVYSANVFSPFGYFNKLLFEDFDKPSVIWGIDGDWMVNLIPAKSKFYPTDHCGYIRIKNDKIHPRYFMWLLHKEGKRLNFSRSYRASIERIEGVSIKFVDMKYQLPVVKEVDMLEKKIADYQDKIEQLSKRYAEIVKRYI
ncbi:MAG: N-6 DNA methylase [Eubacteriales bacterium]|nr:N-6 DNA methylase [Eubacteriales bacterium]